MDATWMAARRAQVPSVLNDVLASAEATHDDPRDAAAALLREAVIQSDSRKGAWPLLGADALISYLCEHALEVEATPEAQFAEAFRLCLGAP